MPRTCSAYSIDVGQRHTSGYREVTLKHRGQPVFAVTHREVQQTFLTFFHKAGERPCAALTELDFDLDDHAQNGDDSQLSPVGRRLVASPRQTAQEYLCVFHREELKDRFDRYVVLQPTTFCSAYTVRDGTHTVFALQGISPTSITPARTGVFVHGTRQNNRRGPTHAPTTIEFRGSTYVAASDVWWMASPLVIMPLYIAKHAAVADCVSQSQDPPLSPGLSQCQHLSEGNPRQPAQRGSTTAARLGGQILSQFCVSSCGGHTDEKNSDEARATLLAIVRTGKEELRLARTDPVYHLDAMTLTWAAQRVRVPGLSANAAALTFTVSEHPVFADEQAVFVYDSLQSTVHILRVSGLCSATNATDGNEEGEGMNSKMELLFTLRNADFPLVLPCIRCSSPQPVLVCNYPHSGDVALFSLSQLLDKANAKQVDKCVLAQRSLAPAAVSTPSHPSNMDSSDDQSTRGRRTRTSLTLSDLGVDHGERSYVGSGDEAARIVAVEYQDNNSVAFLLEEQDDITQLGACLRESTVTLPSLQTVKDALLHYVLEALEAMLGSRAVYELEEELVRRTWHADVEHRRQTNSVSSMLFDVIREAVLEACGGQAKEALASAPGSSCVPDLPPASPQRLLSALWDPLALTADAVTAFATKPTGTLLPRGARRTAWSLTTAAKCTVALHLLCESCRMQAKLHAFPDPLAELVRSLCEALRWEPYVSYYDRFASLSYLGRTPSVPRSVYGDLITAAVVRQQFTFVSQELDFSMATDGADGAERGCMSQSPADSAMPSSVHPTTEFFASLPPDPARVGGWFKTTQEGRGRLGADHAGRRTDEDIIAMPVGRGEPVDVLGALRDLVGVKRWDTVTSFQAFDVWPLLRGLPYHHPIAIANDVFRLVCRAVLETNPIMTEDANASPPGNREPGLPWWYRVCCSLAETKQSALDSRFVREELTIGVAHPILCALTAGRDQLNRLPDRTREQDPSGVLAAVVGRLDCVEDGTRLAALTDPGQDVVRLAEERAVGRQYQATLTDDDGVMLRLDFPQVWRDSRLDAAQVYLNTSRPIPIPTRNGGEQPADLLKGLALRVCAMPIGRGMLTMSTHNFKVRDCIPVPRLNLNGRTRDGVMVANTKKELQPDHLSWPAFHNGCAAGLRFLPLNASAGATPDDSTADAADGDNTSGSQAGAGKPNGSGVQGTDNVVITRHWVVYQTKAVRSAPARAGLLLAAGVLGHLKVLQLTDIYSLLVSPRVYYNGREATTMAVMLGLSCSFRGTSNDLVFRCLSMHVQSLTPSAEEIDVSLDVQTCALLSIGLLCQRSPTNGFLVDMFLMEMSRLPSDEHCVNREGYALGAGFGLGLLLLGLGATHGIPHVEERLFRFLEGGRRDAAPVGRDGGREVYEERNCDEAGNFLTRALLLQAHTAASRTTCTRVYEGDYYNTAVSGPAAAVALGFMFLKTDNEAIARKLLPPDRVSALQAISPLLCLLRTCFACLTCWSSTVATYEFIHETCVPSVLRSLKAPNAVDGQLAQQQVHYLMMNHGHCIAGAVMALGLRFAGSMDTSVRDTLLAELNGFLEGRLGATGISVPVLQRSTGAYETCIAVCCIAVSLVMAGTGDLKAFALFQRLNQRSNAAYGSHMALSMSVGLLFLGGGRLSLSTSTESIAALVMAFYPVWPRDPESNAHHLQILRHLYGLAVVPRVMETFDAITNRPVSVPVRIVLRKADEGKRSVDVFGAAKPPTPSEAAAGEEEAAGKRGGGQAPHAATQEGRSQCRELRVETPCLYPPPEMIDHVEIRSTEHYHRTIFNKRGREQDDCRGDSRQLLGEGGLVVRVLENPSAKEEKSYRRLESRRDADSCADVGASWRNPAERDLLQQVRRLFSRRGTSLNESIVLIDNIKLLAASQQRLVALLAASGSTAKAALTGQRQQWDDVPGAVSADVCRAVVRTLERRYRALFVHGPADTRSGHPLHRVLLKQEPLADVAAAIVAHPEGTAAFPLDFTAMCGSETTGTSGSVDVGVTVNHVVVAGVDRGEVERWLAEAVHFFFGNSNELGRLGSVVRAAAPQLSDRATRTLALLKVNKEARLPIHVLQQVLSCCFAV